MSLAEVIEYFDNYIERFRLPALCGVEVFSVEKVGDRYVVRTSEKNFSNYGHEHSHIALSLRPRT
jgi:hypothetical protein